MGVSILAMADSTPLFEPIKPPRPVGVVAHRGESRVAPENTRAAVIRSIADGLEWVEVDVRRTKDGRHVIVGPEQINAISDGQGLVKEMTYAELARRDAGSWFAKRFVGERFLTLEELLSVARGKINVYLDLKDADPAKVADAIIDASMTTQTLVFGSTELLARFREARPTIPRLAPLRSADTLDAVIKENSPAAIEIDGPLQTPEIVGLIHSRGLKVLANCLGADDTVDGWRRAIEAGADWIQTDSPERMLAYSFQQRFPSKKVGIAFHRGASSYAPENSRAAIETAIAMGATYVEIDVRATADGQLYLMHDSRIDRTTDARGEIGKTSSNAVTALDVGAWFGRPFLGAKAPLFTDALLILRGKANAYVDAKSIPPETLAKILRETGMLDHSVVYQGRDYLKRLKEIEPKARLMPPLGKASDIEGLARDLAPYAVDASWRILSREVIDRCHAHGIKVFSDALGLNERIGEYQKAIRWGIDVIQTDHPLRVMRAIETLPRE